jgi:hypothetical protein
MLLAMQVACFASNERTALVTPDGEVGIVHLLERQMLTWADRARPILSVTVENFPSVTLEMNMADYAIFLIAFAAAAALPGPEIAALLSRSLSGGVASSLPLALGLILGKVSVPSAAVLGPGAGGRPHRTGKTGQNRAKPGSDHSYLKTGVRPQFPRSFCVASPGLIAGTPVRKRQNLTNVLSLYAH